MWARSCCGATGATPGRSSSPPRPRSAPCSSAWRSLSQASPPARSRGAWWPALIHLGELVNHARTHLVFGTTLIGQLLLDMAAAAARTAAWAVARCIGPPSYRMGAMALPITALVGFLIGVVLAYLMALQLRQFGAEAFIVNIWAFR